MKKSSRYWVRLTLAFINRFKLIFLVGIIMGIIGFVFLSFIFPHLPRGTQKIGLVGEYTPDNLPPQVSNLISEGLTTLDKNGQAVQGIAKSWENSDGGKTWTFHLNKDLHWQDGSSITSRDINYNFSDAQLTRPDTETIVFKLKTTLASFPVVLAKPVFKQGLLGVGDWRVTNLTLTGTYVESLTLMNEDNDQKIFKFYPSEEQAKLAYELGQVKELDNLIDLAPFNDWKTVNITKQVNEQRYVAVFFNTTDEFVGDKDMRQALSYAINKNDYKQTRALGPISPTSWAYNPSVKPYDYDIDHAKTLVKDAKISPDARKAMKITLTTIPTLLPVAESIAKDWKAVGIDTTVQVTQFVPDQYQAFLAIYDTPTDPDQYSIWHSTQTQTNITHYKNTRIDKLLEDGRLETNQEKRKQVYFDFQKFLVEDSPAAFLYYPTYYSVSRK